MSIYSLLFRKKGLPVELVAFINAADVVFRSQGDNGPRPMLWNLIETRPVYADEPEMLRRRIAKHFELGDKQMRRALTLIHARVAERQRDNPSRRHALDGLGGQRKTWVNTWGESWWK